MLVRDGTRLYHADRPGPGQPVVLVHGWCCDHTFLAPQTEYLARLGHRVIAVDLRGHGRSDKPRQSYVDVFADDLAFMCRALALERPIVVGHSMGGIVAYDLARRYPDVPGAIAMIDSAVALPEPARANVVSFLAALRGASYRAAMSRFVNDALFIPTDDAARRRRIVDRMAETPQHVMVAAYEALAGFDLALGGAGPAVPCLYVQADEPSPRTDLARLLALAPQTMTGRTVGSGHFCQLEVPDQVNAMIHRFITLACAGIVR